MNNPNKLLSSATLKRARYTLGTARIYLCPTVIDAAREDAVTDVIAHYWMTGRTPAADMLEALTLTWMQHALTLHIREALAGC